jgi:hypothetical protein
LHRRGGWRDVASAVSSRTSAPWARWGETSSRPEHGSAGKRSYEPVKGTLAHGYSTSNQDVSTLYDPSYAWTAGAIVASAGDIADWAVALYGGGGGSWRILGGGLSDKTAILADLGGIVPALWRLFLADWRLVREKWRLPGQENRHLLYKWRDLRLVRRQLGIRWRHEPPHRRSSSCQNRQSLEPLAVFLRPLAAFVLEMAALAVHHGGGDA